MHGCGTAKTHAQARRPYPNSNIFFILHTFRRPTIHVSRLQISKKQQSLQSHTCQIPMRPKFLYTNAIRANTRLDQLGEAAGLHSQVPYLLSLLHHGIEQPAAVTSRRRCHDIGIAPASTQEGAARRLRVGLKTGPGTAARLEAGNCGEVFACLFQVCAVLPHQACADGSVFFCRRLPKAGLSGFV